MRKKERATKKLNSAQIAKLAGVSRSTVSRVINGYANVKEETRLLVMDTIKKHGYYPSMSGQVLAGKRVKCIGLFWIPNGPVSRDSLASFFMVTTIESAARMGYLALTCIVPNLNDPDAAEHVKSIFYQGRIDAGIFIGMGRHEPLIEELVADGMIVGLFDYAVGSTVEDNRFITNFEQDTGDKVMDYLVSLGHRKIALINGACDRPSSRDRRDGFLRGMVRHNIEVREEWMRGGNAAEYITRSGGYKAAKEILSLPGEKPTVICCNNDAAAQGAYRAAAEMGIEVGRELSIIGIDGDAGGASLQPPLTTFDMNFAEVFESLVRRMIQSLEGQAGVPRLEIVRSRLVERGSCARVQIQKA